MKYILILVQLLINLILFGQGTIIINEKNNNEEFDLSGNLFYFIDTTSQLTFEQALSNNFFKNYHQSPGSQFSLKQDSYDHWILIPIENLTSKSHDLILSINNSNIQEIVFYSSVDSSFYNTGSLYPFFQRQFPFKNFLFELSIPAQSNQKLCIKVSGQELPVKVPISLKSSKKFFDELGTYQMINGIFSGLIALTILMILLLWMTEKDKIYISLFLLVINLVILLLLRNQIIFQYLFPYSPRLNINLGNVLTFSVLFLIMMLINNLFNIHFDKKYFRTYYRLALGIGFILLFAIILIQKPLLFRYSLIIYFVLTSIFWILAITNKGVKSKKGYIHNSFTILLILLVFGLDIFHMLDFNESSIYDDYFSKITLIICFFLITAAFVSKFWNSRIEVFELNRNLEQKVQKRTAQINQQKEELRTQHEELIQQKEILQTQREELRAQKELLQVKNLELEKLSQVTSKTNNLITIFKPNGEIDWFNASFSKILGFSLEEYLHGEPINFLDVSANKNIKHVLNTCVREKAVVSYESHIRMENGETRWFHTTLTPILDERENIKHLIAIDTDITRLKQYEAEIEQQRIDAESQKNLAINRKEELELQQMEIFDSIRYAKRIQTAIMPKVKQIQRDFDDSFVLFLPKDIVSGDFYWYHRIENKYFVAAVDCTGHGVPGAFMSIIGNYLLNSIVIHNGIHEPAEILKHLNRKIKISLKSDGYTQTSDGMDVAMVVIDKDNKTIEFAGALRPLYLFSGNQFIELKGDKVPITSSISGTSISSFTPFTNSFNPGDTFYIFSDGIIDQFGGDKGKKFLTKRFKQLLFDINPLQMKDQKEIIKKAFDDWRGNYEQVDDVMVLGIRYTDNM